LVKRLRRFGFPFGSKQFIDQLGWIKVMRLGLDPRDPSCRRVPLHHHGCNQTLVYAGTGIARKWIANQAAKNGIESIIR
jgi:hypothetical protein